MAGAGGVKALLIWLHRWLGIGLALVFVVWFISGVVMYFVPYPHLGDSERLRTAPALTAGADCCLTLDQALARAQLGASASQRARARLGDDRGRLVWRLPLAPAGADSTQSQWRRIDAISGAVLPPLDREQSAALAAHVSQRAVRAIAALPPERDTWTLSGHYRELMPLYRISMAAASERAVGDDGLVLYVSANNAEVVLDTRRAERGWNWLGTVPHWLYFAALRHSGQWSNTVIALASVGVAAAVSGLLLGVWQLFLNPKRCIPYRVFWLRWHHLLGLIAGAVTFSWILSGLLSMNPAGVFAPAVSEQARWRGETPAPAAINPGAILRQASARGLKVRELHELQLAGQRWYAVRTEQARYWRRDSPDQPALLSELPSALLTAQLRQLRPAHGQPVLTLIHSYDHNYYSRSRHAADSRWFRPLPVWRARWPDGALAYTATANGQLMAETNGSRHWQRVLYNGLHSFDFAPLLARPALRTALIVGLSIAGLALSVSSCAVAYQHFSRRAKLRRQRRANAARTTPPAPESPTRSTASR